LILLIRSVEIANTALLSVSKMQIALSWPHDLVPQKIIVSLAY
jgi:hypothetical protein